MPSLRHIASICFQLLVFSLAASRCAAFDENQSWWDNNSPATPEYRAASVVTNLWLSAFAVTSAVFGILGAIVALQWPNPRVLCYKTSYSDIPSNSGRSCCSLYSLNLAFCVFWLLVFAIMVVARDLLRIIVCLSFALGHGMVIVAFRMKFKRFGRPERSYGQQAEVVASHSVSDPALGPRQALGIPIYNIPMRTVVIGEPISSNTDASNQQTQTSSYWYDAACIPPQQQAMPNVQPAAAGTVPGTSGPHALAPNTAHEAVGYPPQPHAYTMYASYPPAVTGVAVGAAVAAGALPAAQPAATGAVAPGPSGVPATARLPQQDGRQQQQQ